MYNVTWTCKEMLHITFYDNGEIRAVKQGQIHERVHQLKNLISTKIRWQYRFEIYKSTKLIIDSHSIRIWNLCDTDHYNPRGHSSLIWIHLDIPNELWRAERDTEYCNTQIQSSLTWIDLGNENELWCMCWKRYRTVQSIKYTLHEF